MQYNLSDVEKLRLEAMSELFNLQRSQVSDLVSRLELKLEHLNRLRNMVLFYCSSGKVNQSSFIGPFLTGVAHEMAEEAAGGEEGKVKDLEK